MLAFYAALLKALEWSHKIKYKKSIPNPLKRRINTLAALFELADREFRAIRVATEEEIKNADTYELDDALPETVSGPPNPSVYIAGNGLLTAFGFLKIASHFFKDFTFEPFKVDGFTQEIVSKEPTITRTQFNSYMKSTISKVKLYKAEFEQSNAANESLNPFTTIRHCLYLANKEVYGSFLTKISKDSFEDWLEKNKG